MKNIPDGAGRFFATATFGIAPKTLDKDIPQRLEKFNQTSFSQWHPNLVYQHVSAEKIGLSQIFVCCGNGLRMLDESVVQLFVGGLLC